MKKFIKKVSYLLFILSILFVSSSNIYALDSITVTNRDDFNDIYKTYLEAFNLGNEKLLKANDNYVYCLEYSLAVPTVGTNLIKTSSIDLGLGYTYILQNGFPNKSVSGLNDAQVDYAITQAAIYYYQQYRKSNGDSTIVDGSTINIYKDKLNGSNLNKVSDSIDANLSSTDQYKQSIAIKVTDLVDAAIKFEKENSNLSFIVDNDSSELTLSSDGKYYVSEVIMLSQNLSYSVKTNVDGAIIKDTYGNIKTNFAAADEFIIMIPVDKYVPSITLTATTEFNKYSAYYVNDDATGYESQKLVAQDGTQTRQGFKTFTVVKSTTTEPETPDEPNEPETPDEPDEPEIPDVPEDPDTPEESVKQETPKEEVEVPKTAANIPLYVWVIGLISIIAGAKLVYSRAR